VEPTELQGTEIDIPDAVVDFLQSNVFADAYGGNVDPAALPASRASATAISIESLCTSMPTNTVLDFSMACLHSKLRPLRDNFVALCAAAHNPRYSEAGRLALTRSHSV